jgi:hypothetical protein
MVPYILPLDLVTVSDMRLYNNRATGIGYGAIYMEANKIIIMDSIFWKSNIYDHTW